MNFDLFKQVYGGEETQEWYQVYKNIMTIAGLPYDKPSGGLNDLLFYNSTNPFMELMKRDVVDGILSNPSESSKPKIKRFSNKGRSNTRR